MKQGELSRISADKGFIVVHTSDGATRTITVNEALDRAAAIKTLLQENAATQGKTMEIYKGFMEACLEARRQQETLKKEVSEYVDFSLKNEQMRELELYAAKRAIQV